MSDNYPPGPMLDSGVYDVESTQHVYCDACDKYGTADVTRRGRRFMWDCPECGAYNELENER